MWAVFHSIGNFPPKLIAIIIFILVTSSFVSLIKIIHRNSNRYHLFQSIIFPSVLIISPLYYFIPIVGVSLEVMGENMQLYGDALPSFKILLSVVSSVIEEHNFFSLEHIALLFNSETLPLVLLLIGILFINFYGNYIIHVETEETNNLNKIENLL